MQTGDFNVRMLLQNKLLSDDNTTLLEKVAVDS